MTIFWATNCDLKAIVDGVLDMLLSKNHICRLDTEKFIYLKKKKATILVKITFVDLIQKILLIWIEKKKTMFQKVLWQLWYTYTKEYTDHEDLIEKKENILQKKNFLKCL